MSATAMEPRQRMLATARVVRRSDDMSLAIVSLITVEVIELLLTMSRDRPVIPMVRIVPVVHMPMEATRPMEPRPSTDKDPACKPIWPIVSIRCAVIRRIVEVPIWTLRRNTNANCNL